MGMQPNSNASYRRIVSGLLPDGQGAKILSSIIAEYSPTLYPPANPFDGITYKFSPQADADPEKLERSLLYEAALLIQPKNEAKV